MPKFLFASLNASGPLACPVDWFLNGVSCYKANDKDTWKGAQKECTVPGGDLVKVDDDNQKRFLFHFMEVTGLMKANIDVSTKPIINRLRLMIACSPCNIIAF